MQRVEKIWRYPEAVPQGYLADMEDFREIERQVLYLRGINEREQARRFLAGEYIGGDDPFMLSQMEIAAERISRAIDEQEQIIVYADYDADGVTSAALLYTGLQELGGRVGVYFPDRFTEGYGLNLVALERLVNKGCALLLTVDCGIRAVGEVEHARENGLDVIITDHHVPGPVLPEAFALINPRQPGDEYPFKDLAGVGVAHKLMQALRVMRGVPVNERDLELVAIGTVADLVPLVGENRVLVRKGLELLNASQRPGIQKLIEVAGYQHGAINATSIGFGLGPRLNAAGRLKSARLAFDLLVSDDPSAAELLANELDQINRDRQDMMNTVIEKAFSEYGDQPLPGNILFNFHESYHEGVIGLAASKLSDAFYRPTIVGHLKDDLITASARSIPGFHITKALEQASSLLERFGGHSAAAGLRVHKRYVMDLVSELERSFEQQMAGRLLQPVLKIDGIASFDELDDRMLRFHDRLAPFGIGNQRPLLVSENARVINKRTVGSDGSHLKLTLEQNGRPFDAIAFRMGDRIGSLPQEIDVAYRLERNHYLGFVTLQLNVQDFRPAGGEAAKFSQRSDT